MLNIDKQLNSHIKQARRVVIKVGTSTITHESGHVDFRGMESLTRTIADIAGDDKEIILVSSGAIAIGMAKVHEKKRPECTSDKQALAAVGQCELMFLYDKLFRDHNRTVAQVLLTADVLDQPKTKTNIINTFERLLVRGVIPVVNENDTVTTTELEGQWIGDNDTLSAQVAALVEADSLVIITDIEGLYDIPPDRGYGGKLIHIVEEINDKIISLAGDKGSALGTGGMVTKIKAAKIAVENGLYCHILSGRNSRNIYDLFDGKLVGTTFLPNTTMEINK